MENQSYVDSVISLVTHLEQPLECSEGSQKSVV